MAILLGILIATVTSTDIVVPAYFDPVDSGLTDWNTMTNSAKTVPLTVIMNPDDGPGSSAFGYYKTAIAKLRANGAKVIGYVATGYGKNAMATVQAQINKYFSFYTIDGIFFDEMSDDDTPALVTYYQTLYKFVKAKSASYQVMNNPGTNLAETYVKLPVADRFVVYEDKQGNYGAYKALPYMGNYATTRFVHIVYNVTAAQVSGDVNTAIAKHAGGVYLTNLKLPNPYAKLPSFWPQQVSAVAAKNG
ncbi:unnamed protein product, partial [Mesorhabditis belari]|uniref:Spherulation-specific family 4 n=1 Tax=Mesorhabditis belari TaxID=2138241 RepID=A0AAF3EAC6_9BILA